MKSIQVLVLLSILFSACNKVKKVTKPDTIEVITNEKFSDFKIELGRVSKKSVFESDSLSIWGGSLVKGEDGLYHMFYSRWAKKLGWEWVTYSEIAHATSASPLGPFKFKDVTLSMRDPAKWDGTTTHNPTIHKFNGKYYLYYMGNTGDLKTPSTPGKPKLNWVHRNNQRIGVAVADSPNGPWKRFDTPVLDITKNDDNAHDALMTSNPSVCQMADGKILMVYKAVGKKEKLPGGGPVVHLVAIADNPTGPFKKYPEPIFTFKGERFPAEDPYIWYQDGKYRAIVKRAIWTKNIHALAHFESKDGIHWNQGKYFEITDRTITWEDGTIEKFEHLERPQVFIENGEPKVLLCAADRKDKNNVLHSFNIQIPLKITKE